MALLPIARPRDQSIDLQHLCDELAMEALEAGGVDHALRFGAEVARILDDCGGSGQQGISGGGH
jgi:hypothetical protein